jgi:hypothetical protein
MSRQPGVNVRAMLEEALKPAYHALFKPSPVRWLTGAGRVLPDFLIIGAMRSGTSSLYDLLARHPQVQPAIKKEVHFFDLHPQWGENWYRAHFPRRAWVEKVRLGRGGSRITGESSPYYLFHPHAARRAARLVPTAKLIVTLRDPVNRAYSHYWHSVRLGYESAAFERALEAEAALLPEEVRKLEADEHYASAAHRNRSYLMRGLYAAQLARWLAYFPREQVIVLENGNFRRDFEYERGRLFAFLGLPDDPSLSLDREINRAEYPPMRPATRARLQAYFRPHNAALFALLGETFDWGD